MNLYLSILFLSVSTVWVNGSLKCNCNKAQCIQPKNCTTGTVPDMCNCCQICAKNEGELCAGLNQVEGQCGNDLQCMVRDLKSTRNRNKQRIEELVGRCEKEQCHTKHCPYGQVCSIVNETAECTCPICKDMMDEPVCGEKNNKQYENECELRRDECQQRKHFGLIKGRCREVNLTEIHCSDDSITITVAKEYFSKRKQDTKYSLMDGNCGLKENSTHYYYVTKLNDCGTKPTYTLTAVVYSNVIRTYTDPNSTIVRHRTIQLPFECEYSLRSRNRIKISSKGEFGDRLEERLSANGVGIRVRPAKATRTSRSAEPLKVDINHVEKYIVAFKAKSLASLKNSNIYPKHCFVTPVLRSQRWMKYVFLEKGCPTEKGVEILKSQSPVVRLSIPNIKFRGAKYPGVLVKCKLAACLANTTCKKTCDDVNAENNNLNNRKRRDINYKAIDDLIRYGKPLLVQ